MVIFLWPKPYGQKKKTSHMGFQVYTHFRSSGFAKKKVRTFHLPRNNVLLLEHTCSLAAPPLPKVPPARQAPPTPQASPFFCFLPPAHRSRRPRSDWTWPLGRCPCDRLATDARTCAASEMWGVCVCVCAPYSKCPPFLVGMMSTLYQKRDRYLPWTPRLFKKNTK